MFLVAELVFIGLFIANLHTSSASSRRSGRR
jgi:hypothetical protein